ncbi:FG-GAP repeat domain-containing protein [Paracraurococcus lichenis]|uniref:VCBS repeat-containing protein n=1 Tax=Paracraurococcus lichenis TaxID=3064888 RepID=A0ABT9DX28_9PROT|nr:VCBS repeat-containing protein [Paracraurococcus sp. LOR1-02]MDO9708447.1 VCBS repeat-containing protein [Paracraurococcus sp. LOR1-02]
MASISESAAPSLGGAAQMRVTYSQVVIDPAPDLGGAQPLEKALGDLNLDGRPDAILGAGNAGGGGLYWYASPGTGALTDPWAKHVIAETGDFYEDMAILDVNRDGAPDIVASVDDGLAWFENPLRQGGDAVNGPWTRHTIRTDGAAHAIAVADIDGDGRQDIVIAGSVGRGSPPAILFQDGPDAWTQRSFGQVGDGMALLSIGTGKGAINIVGGDGDSVVWYENPRETGGNARLDAWVPHVAATLPHAFYDAFAAGVFTPGGRMDLVVASSEDYPDNPSGLYRLVAPADPRQAWSIQVIDPSYTAVHRVNLADMNRDGLLDIVVAEQEQAHNSPPDFDQDFGQQRVAVFLNQGNGSFAEQRIAMTGGHNQVAVDVNMDGYPDILNANHGVFGAPHPLELWVSQPVMAADWP